jgi:uncharacterized protein (TIGR02246 family)
MEERTMSPKTSIDSRFGCEAEVRALYRQMLNGWNQRNPEAIASLFVDEGDVISADGSELRGREAIASVHRKVFADRPTGIFIGKVRNVFFLSPDCAVVMAVAGMVLPGQCDLDPQRNAIQTLVAVRRDGAWRAAVFQNTPARFNEKPEAAKQLTEELRRLL